MTPTGLLGSTANGEVDSGERGISGVIINLVDSTGAIVETTTTNRFGLYYFDVLPGQWTTQVAPENFNLGGALEPYAPTVDYTNDGNGDNQRTQTVVDADILTYDYGYVAVSGSGSNSLGDQVWVETDGNGDYNTADGDVGLGNVTIDLYFDTPADPNPGDYETFISQVTTEPDGFYDFVNLPNGDYKVVVTDENGATAGLTHILGSNPGQNNNSQEIPYYILNLDSVTQPTNFTADFGYLRAFKPAAIGNYVWVDENNDGLQDAGEVGIPNVTVQLLQNGTVVDTRQTDAQGGYLFDNLEAGTYTVQVDGATIPDGMTQTTNPVLPNADFGNQSQPYTLSVGEGEENLTADFGYNYNIDDEVNNGNGPAVIGDRVWVDVDGDGAQDPNEVGIEGVTVTLYSDPDGDGVYDTVVGTDVTDSNGNYIFDNLPAGGYVVEVDAGTLPTGYVQTGDPDEFGQPATAPDNKTTSPVILAPGDVFLNADFGYQPQNAATGAIGDFVWFDADASGTPEVPGDVADGIAGVSVSLIADSKGNGVWDAGEPVIATDVTDADGRYLFEGLPLNDGDGDADYIVWVNDTDNVLGDLIQTYDADGIGTPDVSAVALSGGAPVNLDQDFSYTAPGHEPGKGLIGDTVFLDAVNNDGGYNPGEGDQPIEGVTVILKDAGGNVIATTETNENGNYYFGGLDPDATYTVEVDPSTLPSGLKPTYDDDGIGTPNSSTVTLTPANLVNLDQDFGYDPSGPLGLIGNEVWLDTNADGFLDGPAGPDGIPGNDDDEPMIEGVTLDLYWDKNANGVIDPGEPKMGTEVTNADGIYRFENLPVDDGGGDRAYIVDVTDEDGVLNGYWHSLGELNGDIVTSPIAPPSATITNFVNDVDKRTIKAGDNEKLTVEFVEQLKNAVDANYSIVVNFTLGCSITFAPGGTPTPVCEATGESTLNISDDKIEWKVLNSGLDDITVESIEIAWPSGHGDIEKINLVGDIVDRNISPPAATITSFDGDIDDRTIEAGKEETLSVEFEDKLEGMNNDDYSITLNFVEGCSVTFDPAATPGGNFACDKPLDLLTMIWDGSTPSVRIKAWKDTPGDQLLADIDNINVGEAVTVDGYAPKDGNDVIWEVFVAGTNTKLGESVYHMSCSDDDMNDAADCGKRQGNGKSNDGGYINDWLLEEMVDANGMLNCTPGIGAAMLQGSAPTTMFEAVFLPFVSNR